MVHGPLNCHTAAQLSTSSGAQGVLSSASLPSSSIQAVWGEHCAPTSIGHHGPFSAPRAPLFIPAHSGQRLLPEA